jgi:Spy/CpxP family protein refolding chaperone
MKAMKRISLKTLVMLLVGILFIGSNQIVAQVGQKVGQGKNNGARVGCPIADLTEAQQKKIDELRIAHQKNMLQFRNQMDIKTANLQSLRTADKADMNAINKTIDEIGVLKTQMMKERENHLQQIRAQLTDNQRLQFDMHKRKGNGIGFGPCGGAGKCGMGMHKGKGMGPGGR